MAANGRSRKLWHQDPWYRANSLRVLRPQHQTRRSLMLHQGLLPLNVNVIFVELLRIDKTSRHEVYIHCAKMSVWRTLSWQNCCHDKIKSYSRTNAYTYIRLYNRIYIYIFIYHMYIPEEILRIEIYGNNNSSYPDIAAWIFRDICHCTNMSNRQEKV